MKPGPLARLNEGCVRLRVSVGRSRKVAPNHIVAAIAEATGISGKRIGKIQCYGDYSLVEVPQELSRRIIREVSGRPIGGVPADLRLYQEGPRSEDRRDHGADRRSRRSAERKPHAAHRGFATHLNRRKK